MEAKSQYADGAEAVLVHAPAGEQRLRNQAPRRWVRVVSRLTVGGAVSILMAVAAVKVCSTEAFARVTGTRALVATSGSMAPVFDAGDVVVVRKVSPDDVRVGDIVTFESDAPRSILVTHRVVRTETDPEEGTMFMTKGDSNPRIDATPVAPDRLVGRFVFSIPRLGLFGIRNGFPFMLLFVAIVLASAALAAGRGRLRSDRPTPPADPTDKRETQGREK